MPVCRAAPRLEPADRSRNGSSGSTAVNALMSNALVSRAGHCLVLRVKADSLTDLYCMRSFNIAYISRLSTNYSRSPGQSSEAVRSSDRADLLVRDTYPRSKISWKFLALRIYFSICGLLKESACQPARGCACWKFNQNYAHGKLVDRLRRMIFLLNETAAAAAAAVVDEGEHAWLVRAGFPFEHARRGPDSYH